MSDRIFGVLVLVLALLYGWGASLTRESFIQDPVGPKVFPYVLAGLAVILAVVIIVKPDKNPKWASKEGFLEVAAALLVMCGYATLLPVLGFVVSTVLAAFYFAWRFGGKVLQSCVTGVSVSVGLYVVFHLILGLTLAEGPLGF